MQKIRALIIDDEPLAREGVRMLLAEDSEVTIVGECSNGRDAVLSIAGLSPDLIFLDVQMPEMSGFEVLDEISAEQMPAVIFVTAYDRYALQAFDVMAVDYLLKPFTKDRFHAALDRARAHVTSKGNIQGSLVALLDHLKLPKKYLERLVVKSSGRVFFVNADQIDWIQAAENYVSLHVGKESHLVHGTMSRLESRLDPDMFMRIHRSTIINTTKIKELRPSFHGEFQVVLKDGTQLSSSRSYRQKLQSLMNDSF